MKPVLMQDNSTCKLQSQMTFRLYTSFLKLGSHYPPPLAGLFDLQILMRFTFKI